VYAGKERKDFEGPLCIASTFILVGITSITTTTSSTFQISSRSTYKENTRQTDGDCVVAFYLMERENREKPRTELKSLKGLILLVLHYSSSFNYHKSIILTNLLNTEDKCDLLGRWIIRG
jgi:hypothetical protein